MSDERTVFNPTDRRRVAEEMFRAALRQRIDAWVEEILNDQSVRDRIVHSVLSGGMWNADVLGHEVREGVLRRARKVTKEIVDNMNLSVNVDVKLGGEVKL